MAKGKAGCLNGLRRHSLNLLLCMLVTLKQVSWLGRQHWTTWPKSRWMSLLTKPTLAPFSTCELGKTQNEEPWACGLTDVGHSIEGIPGSPISLHYPTTVIKVSKKTTTLDGALTTHALSTHLWLVFRPRLHRKLKKRQRPPDKSSVSTLLATTSVVTLWFLRAPGLSKCKFGYDGDD
jgi:hypothetical protein